MCSSVLPHWVTATFSKIRFAGPMRAWRPFSAGVDLKRYQIDGMCSPPSANICTTTSNSCCVRASQYWKFAQWHPRTWLIAYKAPLLPVLPFNFCIPKSAFIKKTTMQKNGCGLSRLLKIIIAQSYVRMLLTQNLQHNQICAFLSLKLGNYLFPDAVVPKTWFRKFMCWEVGTQNRHQKRVCAYRLEHLSIQSVVFTSYETAIACRTQICRAALPTILSKVRSCWLFDLAASTLVPFDLSRIKPRSHVVVYLIKYKLQVRNQRSSAQNTAMRVLLFSPKQNNGKSGSWFPGRVFSYLYRKIAVSR